MKRNIWLILFLFIGVVASAQQNQRVLFYNGTIEYKKPSTMNVLGGLLGAVDNNKNSRKVGVEDKSILPALENAVKSAASSVYRLNVQADAAPAKSDAEAYVLNVVLYNVMTYTGNQQGASADIQMSLVDLRTGEEIANKKTGGYDVYSYTTKAEGVTYLCTTINRIVRQFLWDYFPISGTLLQKGVEQNNGKVKDSQCYIDLAENYGAFEGMKLIVYTDDNGKLSQIGSLKIKEVQGQDVSVCTISKGSKKIEKALAAGEKLVVMTKTPKE